MAWMNTYLTALGSLLAELWPYMLAGFLIAGAVEEFVPEERLLRYFGSNDLFSLVRGAAAGFLVSACSCGAIPMVASLRRRGASTATALTFLLASPWLGIPMLLIYVAFLGWARTLLLMGLALGVALCAGWVLARFERRGFIVQGQLYTGAGSAGTACEARPAPHGRPHRGESLRRRLFVGVPAHAWDLGKGIGAFLLVGAALAALPMAAVAPETVAAHLGRGAGPWAVLVALPISVAIEACSEGFAVVAGQLYRMGASLAVVFVVTMVGVATDLTELSVVWGKFGRRTTLVYVALGTSLTLAVGLALQAVL